MKTLPAAGLLLAGIAIGIVVGKTSGFATAGSSPGDDEAGPANTRITKHERQSLSESRLGGIAKIRQARPAELAGVTRRLGETADPVERQRLISECLLNMSAQNWREVVGSFNSLSLETGRDDPEGWKLALFRSGQVAGEEAMNTYLAAGLGKKDQGSWNTLYGWASKDASAALAWLKNAETAGKEVPNSLFTAIIAGAALNDPAEALGMLSELPADQRRGNSAGDLVWNVVQNGGTDALEQVLQHAHGLNGTDPADGRLSDLLYHHAIEKLLWKADHARDAAQACEIITKIDQYGRNPTSTAHQALQKFRWYSVPDKLDLLESASKTTNQSQLNLPFLASAFFKTMSGEGDREAAREWMAKHPDSPLVPHLEKNTQAKP